MLNRQLTKKMVPVKALFRIAGLTVPHGFSSKERNCSFLSFNYGGENYEEEITDAILLALKKNEVDSDVELALKNAVRSMKGKVSIDICGGDYEAISEEWFNELFRKMKAK